MNYGWVFDFACCLLSCIFNTREALAVFQNVLGKVKFVEIQKYVVKWGKMGSPKIDHKNPDARAGGVSKVAVANSQKKKRPTDRPCLT